MPKLIKIKWFNASNRTGFRIWQFSIEFDLQISSVFIWWWTKLVYVQYQSKFSKMNHLFNINKFNVDRMVCWMLRFAFILGKNLLSKFKLLAFKMQTEWTQWNILSGQTGILVYMSNALQLEGLSTKKPRTSKFSPKATAVSMQWKSFSEKSFCAQAKPFHFPSLCDSSEFRECV